VLEFFADKVAWLDTIWDTIHTFIRPVGGAMLALAVVDPSDPVTQVIAFLLGGGASLLAHGGKAGARAVVNTSPEPFSNIAVSTVEDVATTGLLYLAYQYPEWAAGVAGDSARAGGLAAGAGAAGVQETVRQNGGAGRRLALSEPLPVGEGLGWGLDGRVEPPSRPFPNGEGLLPPKPPLSASPCHVWRSTLRESGRSWCAICCH
jgi:hypothetical protein